MSRLTEAPVRLHRLRRLALAMTDLAPVFDFHRARGFDNVGDVAPAVHLKKTKKVNNELV